MLIQTFKANDIITMKLVTGEEIITKFVSGENDSYKVNKPLVLSITPNGVAMTPFLFTAELNGDISIPKHVVVAVAITEKSTAGQYIKGTTGIEPVISNITKLI